MAGSGMQQSVTPAHLQLMQSLISNPDAFSGGVPFSQMLAASPVQAPAQVAQPAYDPNVGYANQYNTALSPEEEKAFQAWGAAQADKHPDNRNPAKDTYDYDMRGFWKSGDDFADNGHAGDKFKKPNHPTFSNLSQYSTPQMPGGQWQQLQDGSWTFTPTAHNLQMNDPGDLQRYFQEREQGNQLILPQQGTQ
jgi:hypothetical protein